MKNLEELFNTLLADRGETHGNYDRQSECAQQLKSIIRETPNWYKLSPQQKEAMEMECTKTSRTLYGNCQHVDNYVDKVGYLLLVLKKMFRDEETRCTIAPQECCDNTQDTREIYLTPKNPFSITPSDTLSKNLEALREKERQSDLHCTLNPTQEVHQGNLLLLNNERCRILRNLAEVENDIRKVRRNASNS